MSPVDTTTELPNTGGGGNAGSSFSDQYFNLYNETDPRKLLFINLEGLTVVADRGDAALIFNGSVGSTTSWTFPDASGAGTIALLELANTWSLLQTFNASIIVNNAGAAINVPGTDAPIVMTDKNNGGVLSLLMGPLTTSTGIFNTSEQRLLDQSGMLTLAGNSTDPPATGFAGRVNRLAQTADIASVKLTDTIPAGQYLIVGELECTTSAVGAGSVTVTFSWTNDVGAVTNAVTQSLTATGTSAILIPAYMASGDITWAVTHTGIYSTAAYALRARVLALG
jgi:hypothetical protein